MPRRASRKCRAAPRHAPAPGESSPASAISRSLRARGAGLFLLWTRLPRRRARRDLRSSRSVSATLKRTRFGVASFGVASDPDAHEDHESDRSREDRGVSVKDDAVDASDDDRLR